MKIIITLVLTSLIAQNVKIPVKTNIRTQSKVVVQEESIKAASKPLQVPEQPKPVISTPKPVELPPAAPTQPTGDSKAFVYAKESGNNPLAINASSGACGLGQALPCSKLLAACPVLADYACQDNWFTQYMLNRYGTWENARAFWLAHNWW